MDEDYWLSEGWDIAKRMKGFINSLSSHDAKSSINETRHYEAALQQWLMAVRDRMQRRLNELGLKDE